MEEKGNNIFGLLGKNIAYSFSRGYFTKKFEKLGFTNHKYVNFDIQNIEEFPSIIKENKKNLKGWLKQEQVECYRLYDADIPEYNVAVDVYGGRHLLYARATPVDIYSYIARRKVQG